jgi:hypothetical protein
MTQLLTRKEYFRCSGTMCSEYLEERECVHKCSSIRAPDSSKLITVIKIAVRNNFSKAK